MFVLTFESPEDENKFLTIYEKFSKTVYYTLKRFNFDPHTIEDLSQDVYLVLSTHLNDIDLTDPKRAQNYIITITRNISKNHIEALKRQPYTVCDVSSDLLQNQLSYTDHVLDSLILDEQIRLIKEEINKLDKKYKIVLELKYLGHLSNSEIASILKIKKKTVEMQLYRAKQLLYERIAHGQK
ncbi:MAG: sigma-70 family RNA polymerase sigma factor [Lachnospiraceae bacterium]|nr:sigma-70 family RNA polymerase sigma factor [Lachnospiraceae bacterium]MBR6152025.1 sigma-70 family RNA polymerase sigma factor [Lachnospiraceae bacterium]